MFIIQIWKAVKKILIHIKKKFKKILMHIKKVGYC